MKVAGRDRGEATRTREIGSAVATGATQVDNETTGAFEETTELRDGTSRERPVSVETASPRRLHAVESTVAFRSQVPCSRRVASASG